MTYTRGIVNAVRVSAFILASVVGVSSGYAQHAGQEIVVPTSAQLELNDAGVQAIIAGDYKLAVKLFDSSLALGPINITYVNRGRALQNAGMCEEAEESFEAAFSAPAMTEPSAANVAATIERYRVELHEMCPGKVLLDCEPGTLRVSIDGKDIGECPKEALVLTKGEHQIRGTLMGKSVETVVDVAPLTVRRLVLKLDVETTGSDAGVASGLTESDSSVGIRPLVVEDKVSVGSGSKSTGYWLLSGGAALLAGGIVLDNVPSTAGNRQYDHVDVVPAGLYVGAGLLVIYGVRALMN